MRLHPRARPNIGKPGVIEDASSYALAFEASDTESVVADFMSRKSYFAVIISRGRYKTLYASAQFFRGRRNTFEASM